MSASEQQFVDADLKGARFNRSNLAGAIMRGVDVQGLDIDAPWLCEEGGSLIVNSVDVAPLVEAELNRRFPGRAERRAPDPEGLRAAWAALETSWAAALDRVRTMPAGTVDISVEDEWTFTQTLRHLILATDLWLGKAVLQITQPLHPIGLPHAEFAEDGHDMSVFTSDIPSYDEVLIVRAERVAMVRDFLATVTTEYLAQERRNPHAPEYPETVLSCVHVILNEEWEHVRYALRDLDAIESQRID